ncbi:hypothetical protein DQ04_13581000 [Trypanosoma grayi]|uniref:hypothetical protein n=1 Tax=Trypanosoma grayi TaxID=71804 RepID=UPI0004F48F43|nr:hypothetical protein DQ04_13581000 [Trypanosoma grayi]KEG06506.1 hypothetical protein DQ04_13581000 [Trypanosoma grayi]
MLLLWLRDTTGGRVEVPAAVVAQLDSGAARGSNGRLRELLQRCEGRPATRKKRAGGVMELCCGVVHAVSSGAVFDQQFARSAALFRRLEATAAAAAAAETSVGRTPG